MCSFFTCSFLNKTQKKKKYPRKTKSCLRLLFRSQHFKTSANASSTINSTILLVKGNLETCILLSTTITNISAATITVEVSNNNKTTLIVLLSRSSKNSNSKMQKPSVISSTKLKSHARFATRTV